MSGAADFRHRVRFDKQVYVDDLGETIFNMEQRRHRQTPKQMTPGNGILIL
jgi:hypothetical protein